jgi:hypothetical protein
MEEAIYNTHMQMKAASEARPEEKVFCLYSQTGDTTMGTAIQVMYWLGGIAYETDRAGAAWYEYGMKTFHYLGAHNKKKAIQDAIEWVMKKYGVDISGLVGNADRNKVPAWVNKQFPIRRNYDSEGSV